MIWFLSLLIGFTIQPNNRHFIIPEKDIHYVNQFFPDSILDYRIDRGKNRIYITAAGIPIAVFPDGQDEKFNAIGTRIDSVIEIWLPDSTGGVLNPREFALNSLNKKVYVIGENGWNIAVCNAETGARIRSIKTDKGTRALAYSQINNKIYCANYYDSTISIVDGATDSILKNIKLSSQPSDLVWNNINNSIYCAHLLGDSVSVIECEGDTVISIIPIGNNPRALLHNPISNKIYCSYQTDIAIIDGNSNNIIGTVPAGYGTSFAFNWINNKIYCINGYDDEVSIIDGIGDTLITTIPLGNDPYSMSYNSVMNRIYIGRGAGEDICVIDGVNDQLIGTIYLGDPIHDMAYDSLDNRLFAALGRRRAAAIDCSTNAIITYLPAGYTERGIFWESEFNQVWIGNTSGGNAPGYTVDGYSGDLLQHQFRTIIGFPPYSSALNISSGKLYSVSRLENNICILNLNSPGNAILKTVENGPWDVIYNSMVNKAYCANRFDLLVSVIDCTTDSTIATIETGPYPVCLTLNRVDNKIYSANFWGDNVTIIDGNTNNLIKHLSVGSRPHSLLWNSTDNKIYTGNRAAGTVTIVDANVDTVITSVNVGADPWSLCHNALNDKIYCANYTSHDITVIDGIADTVIATISLNTDDCPFTLTYNLENNKVYCANIFGESVTIINGANDSIITTIQLIGCPYSLLYNPIDKAIYCAYVNVSQTPWKDAIIIIDGETNAVIDDFCIDSYIGVVAYDAPQKALVLDSLQNIIYFANYLNSKISKIEGLVQGVEKSYDSPTKSPSLRMFPNPFSSYLWIKYSQERCAKIRVRIYDVSGRLVKKLVACDEYPDALAWDGNDFQGCPVPPGIYFLKLNGKNVGKVVKVR